MTLDKGTTVWISNQGHARSKLLAKYERRSVSAEIEWLVERRLSFLKQQDLIPAEEYEEGNDVSE